MRLVPLLVLAGIAAAAAVVQTTVMIAAGLPYWSTWVAAAALGLSVRFRRVEPT